MEILKYKYSQTAANLSLFVRPTSAYPYKVIKHKKSNALLGHAKHKDEHPHNFPIVLFLFRSSTCLFISVCYTGSVEEPQHGENTVTTSTHLAGSVSSVSVWYYDF